MRAANLLPSDLRTERRRPPAAAFAVGGFGLLVGALLAVGFVSAHAKVDDRQAELAAARAELAAVPQPVDRLPLPDTAKDGRAHALGSALSSRVPWDRVLREVSLVLPEDVWLSTLTARSGAAAPAGAAAPTAGTPQGLTVNGYTYSQEAVARLLTRLALVPDLTNVTLQKSARSEIGEQPVVSFTIGADLKSGGAS